MAAMFLLARYRSGLLGLVVLAYLVAAASLEETARQQTEASAKTEILPHNHPSEHSQTETVGKETGKILDLWVGRTGYR